MNNAQLKEAVVQYLDKVGGKEELLKLRHGDPDYFGPFADKMSRELLAKELDSMREAEETIMDLDGLLRKKGVISSKFQHEVLTEKDRLRRHVDALLLQNKEHFGVMLETIKVYFKKDPKQ